MQNIWYLVCISVWITSGYADITDEQMTYFKDELLVTIISRLSENMISQFSHVNNKVDKLQKKIENMEGQMSSIEVAADSIGNELKALRTNISLVQKEQDNKIINHFEGMNFTLHSLETDMNDLKVLIKNISFIEKEQDDRIMKNFEGMNFTLNSIETEFSELNVLRKNISLIEKEQDDSIMKKIEGVNITLSSLESKLEGVFENMSLIEKEQECKVVNNFQNVNEEIGSVKNKIDEFGRNLSAIVMQQESKIVTIQKKLRPRSCSDIYKQGNRTSEPVEIFPYFGHPDDSVSVICDHVQGGRNWTVIQKRKDVQPRENFTRPWEDYVQGFGKFDGEFWVGLNLIQALCSQGSQELHISLEDWEGNKRYAKYSHFFVGPPEYNYRLTVTGYSGDAGDAMAYHNGQAFSTYDQDNDGDSDNYGDRDSCAEEYKAGWWYGACHEANLNGLPDRAQETEYALGINWKQWKGYRYSLKNVTMKIRPIN